MNYITRRHHGMTLIELIVVVVLISILASAAIPASRDLIEATRNRAAVNDLFSLFNTARAEAIRSGRATTVCPIDPSTGTCGSDWNQPVYLFEDPYTELGLGTNARVVRILPPPQRGTIAVNSLNNRYFNFKPDGRLGGFAGNVTWCPNSREAGGAAHIIISPAGRLRLARDLNGDGIVEKANGDPVSC